MSAVCPECGAVVPAGGSCRDNFNALLALEYSIPGASGELAHFYAVAAYGLQHPDSMNYTADALASLCVNVADALDGTVTVEELRQRAREFGKGPVHVVRRDGEAAFPWRRGGWPMTVVDVLTVEAESEAYGESVTTWARSVRETLDADGS